MKKTTKMPEQTMHEDATGEIPELSEAILAKGVRLSSLPGQTLLEKLQSFQKRRTKQSVTIRLDPEIVDYYREKGRGWQTRINSALRACMETELAGARQ